MITVHRQELKKENLNGVRCRLLRSQVEQFINVEMRCVRVTLENIFFHLFCIKNAHSCRKREREQTFFKCSINEHFNHLDSNLVTFSICTRYVHREQKKMNGNSEFLTTPFNGFFQSHPPRGVNEVIGEDRCEPPSQTFIPNVILSSLCAKGKRFSSGATKSSPNSVLTLGPILSFLYHFWFY